MGSRFVTSLRFNYQLLYIRTLLSQRINTTSVASTYDQLRVSKKHLNLNLLFPLLQFSKKDKTTALCQRLNALLPNLDVSKRAFSFINTYQKQILFFFVKLARSIKKRNTLRYLLPSKRVHSRFSSLRFMNLCSFSRQKLCNSMLIHKYAEHNVLLQFYALFLFLSSSCLHDELLMTSCLRHYFSRYMLAFSFNSNSVVLNRFMFNSFFFYSKHSFNHIRSIKQILGSTLTTNRLKGTPSVPRKSQLLRRVPSTVRRRISWMYHKRARQFTSSLLYKRSKLFLSQKRFSTRARSSFISNARRQFETNLFSSLNTKLTLFKSSRSFSMLSGFNLINSRYDTSLLRSFVMQLNQFIYKSRLVHYPSNTFISSFYNVNSCADVFIPYTSLFSFYKKNRLSRMRRLLKMLRFIDKNTYNLYLNATGSNMYSTFLHRKRVLYSVWSGLFGFKKRLKSRKGAVRKISRFFHRYISTLYRQRSVRKLNIISSGLSKFLNIFIRTFGRQATYSSNYYFAHKKHLSHLSKMLKCVPFFLKRKKSNTQLLFKSFIPSFFASFINLNIKELHKFVPELSSYDFELLNSVLQQDITIRSNFLLSAVQSSRSFLRFSDKNANSRLQLINRLISIFMFRYGINSQKDFYVSVHYLKNYRSSLLQGQHIDSSDFKSAYSILYLLELLKYNNLYISKINYMFRRLRRRLYSYTLKGRKVLFKQKKRYKFKMKQRFRRFSGSSSFIKKKVSSWRYRNFIVSSRKKGMSFFTKSRRRLLRSFNSLFGKFTTKLLSTNKFKLFFRSYLKRSMVTQNFNIYSAFKSLLFKLFSSFVIRHFKSFRPLLTRKQKVKLFNHYFGNLASVKTLRQFFMRLNHKKRLYRLRNRSLRSTLINRCIYNAFSRFIRIPFSKAMLFVDRASNGARYQSKEEIKLRKLALVSPSYMRTKFKFVMGSKGKRKRKPHKPHGFYYFNSLHRRRYRKRKYRNSDRRRAARYTKNRKRLGHIYVLRFLKSFRLIRTRMRNYIQLVYTIGYVKHRTSLSHGGCAARKRDYDKRYI